MTLREGTERRILDAADELFFTRGVAATPIDAVIDRAGVSAATLYRGFASKEALLAAALRRRQRVWIQTWDEAVAAAPDDVSRVLAVFDALDTFRGSAHGSRWCAFLGAAAEHAEPPAEVAEAVRTDTESLRSRLEALARPLVGDGAGEVADELVLVVTGDLAMRLRYPDATSATSRRIAATLLSRRHEAVGEAVRRGGDDSVQPGLSCLR
ncbi:helix-turn-helix domain-containing protein [Microbacterium sp. ET2]|uniref:TetR/AcrR family transcriptional regulator n=1 Tax=Microbacterium albipurpureum TaxID=3050384 RepID=UPI00259CEFE0|nr:TetR/AcrR family transcriptional regulator [Microbacterium sp. ET2 (Ac-2212)]WJL97187.1 helix-turn-helix domain-containing protein [Microbacterium sp. ET2 (Ac-2212)]